MVCGVGGHARNVEERPRLVIGVRRFVVVED